MTMYLGAHVSIAGGFSKCIDRIAALGGNCLMTFASSPRSLKTSELPKSEIEKYLKIKQAKKIGPHFFHAPYLINLATSQKSFLSVSQNTLIAYQRHADLIGAQGTIFHIGSHKGQGFSKVVDQIVLVINFILDSTPKGIRLYLENAAGQADTVGASFGELAQIISRVGDKSKIGVCLDTQHAWASGYQTNTLLTDFNKIIGMKYLKVIHLNDSKTDFDSHVDRHENLGAGKIGAEALKKFVSDPRLSAIPIILEVPGDGNGPRKKDIDTLKNMLL